MGTRQVLFALAGLGLACGQDHELVFIEHHLSGQYQLRYAPVDGASVTFATEEQVFEGPDVYPVLVNGALATYPTGNRFLFGLWSELASSIVPTADGRCPAVAAVGIHVEPLAADKASRVIAMDEVVLKVAYADQHNGDGTCPEVVPDDPASYEKRALRPRGTLTFDYLQVDADGRIQASAAWDITGSTADRKDVLTTSGHFVRADR